MSHLNDEFDDWADRGMARLSAKYHHPSNPVVRPVDVTPREQRCAICEEQFTPDAERAEMFFPDLPDADNVIVHAECGLARGMEIA